MKQRQINELTLLLDEKFNSDYSRSEFIDVIVFYNVETEKLIVECHDRFKFEVKKTIRNFLKNNTESFAKINIYKNETNDKSNDKTLYYIDIIKDIIDYKNQFIT